MIIQIINHDKINGFAVIKFEHNGVTLEQAYDLGMVIPGTRHVLRDLGMEFTVDVQQRAIDHLTQVIKRGIEDGSIVNAPALSPELQDSAAAAATAATIGVPE